MLLIAKKAWSLRVPVESACASPRAVSRVPASTGCAVVSCPRSNTNLECGRFPLAEYLAAGVEAALGTDSVASGETLDIRDELNFARQLYPEMDPRLLLRAAVKGGARVLGLKVPPIRRGERWQAEWVWDGPR